MRHMYSHPGEYRKIFLANYLCIGFVPGGTHLVAVMLSFFKDSRCPKRGWKGEILCRCSEIHLTHLTPTPSTPPSKKITYNSENRRKIGQNIGKSYFLPIFWSTFPFLAYFSPIFWISGFFYSVDGQDFCNFWGDCDTFT